MGLFNSVQFITVKKGFINIQRDMISFAENVLTFLLNVTLLKMAFIVQCGYYKFVSSSTPVLYAGLHLPKLSTSLRVK